MPEPATANRSSGASPPGAGAARRTSGDLAVVSPVATARWWPAIDGLGHGSEAARAARRPPRSCARPRQEISSVWSSAATTRSGAHAGRRSAWRSFPPQSKMTWLGVGNVEGRVLSGDPSATRPKGSLALERGVPGHELPPLRTATLAVRPGDVLVLATDGIEAAFADSLDISGSPQAISERILAAHWKHPDDALVVAVRYLGCGHEPPPGPAAIPRAYASALGEYVREPDRGLSPRRLRARARGGQPTAERARPGRRPPGSAVGVLATPTEASSSSTARGR